MHNVKEVLVGCSGWFYLHWKKAFYPEDIPTNSWFKYYNGKFDTVEINSSFYSFPDKNRVRKWYSSSSEDFKFSVKMNRLITHNQKLENSDADIKSFYSSISHLREKLASVLFQFPPSFRYSERNIKRVEEVVGHDSVNFAEFRHITWYTEVVLRELSERNINVVTVGTKSIPFKIPNQKSIYIRMHGDVNGYSTDYKEETLRDLVNKIHSLSSYKAQVYFNNDYSGYAPKNAIYLKRLLAQGP